MDNLISRQAAIDALNEKCLMPAWCKVLVKKMLTDLPSAEPEVISCIECIHYTPLGKDESWGRCAIHSSPTENQRMCQSCDFCAWAERKADE